MYELKSLFKAIVVWYSGSNTGDNTKGHLAVVFEKSESNFKNRLLDYSDEEWI